MIFQLFFKLYRLKETFSRPSSFAKNDEQKNFWVFETNLFSRFLPSLDERYFIMEEPGLHFTNLQALRVLALDHNNIARIDAKAFAGLGNLQRLYLNGNQLSELPTTVFDAQKKGLEAIDLSGDIYRGRRIRLQHYFGDFEKRCRRRYSKKLLSNFLHAKNVA